MYITPEGRDSSIPADAVSSMWNEAVCQAMWYVYTGWINFSTQHGVAIFNEFFVRISVVRVIERGSNKGSPDKKGSKRKGPRKTGLKKKRSKNDSANLELVMAVEVHPSVSVEETDHRGESGLAGLSLAPSRARPTISFADFLRGSCHENMWKHPPNSLVGESIAGVRQVDEKAMARLSAQIHLGFFLAATATPSSFKQPPIASEDPSDPHDTKSRRCRDKEDEVPPNPLAYCGTRSAGPSRAPAADPMPRTPSPHQTITDDTSHSISKASQQDCQRPSNPGCDGNFDESQDLAGQAALYDDDLQMGDSCGGPAEDDARKYLLTSNISVLLLHPSEMDALIRHMHGGSVKAPTADLHDWFLSVDPSPAPGPS